MTRTVVLGLITLGLTSCVTTTLTPSGERVRVTTNTETVRGCDFVGEVKASDRMNGGALGQDAAEENTYRRLRNDAAAMGGNIVLLNRASTGRNGSTARGEVFRCPEAGSAAPPTKVQ
jgi:hypothetical protein